MSQVKKCVVIVDDHPMVRAGLKATLETHGGFEVGGEAATAAEVMVEVERKKPDVLLLDLSLKRYDGITLIKEIRSRWPNLPILVHSMHDEDTFAPRALKAGALGYLMKDVHPNEVIEGLLKVLDGDLALSRRMTTRLCKVALESPRGVENDPVRDRLSDRELHVFQMLGSGLSTRKIAEELHLSPKTIEAHREHIKEKLNLLNSEQLLECARRWVDGK